MDKVDFKELAKKAKANADAGIRKAGAVAQKAAADVNDGLDSAKENFRKSAIAKNAVKELQDGIRDLEKENKTKVQEEIQEETNAIINQLKSLTKIIKVDPENSFEAIESLVKEYRNAISTIVDSDAKKKNVIRVQVMPKRYEEALGLCLSAKAAIEKTIEAASKR